jgi:hypothetical protein
VIVFDEKASSGAIYLLFPGINCRDRKQFFNSAIEYQTEKSEFDDGIVGAPRQKFAWSHMILGKTQISGRKITSLQYNKSKISLSIRKKKRKVSRAKDCLISFLSSWGGLSGNETPELLVRILGILTKSLSQNLPPS